MATRLLQKPLFTGIDYRKMHFIIMDSPNLTNVDTFVTDCLSQNVSDVVRVCESKYPKEPFIAAGIEFHDWEFDDGSPPPDAIIQQWINLLKGRFLTGDPDVKRPIAVHCLAGLGRAPVLVAIALIELGMPSTDAVEYIRARRKGAFNDRQLHYLTHYRGKNRLKQSRKCLIL